MSLALNIKSTFSNTRGWFILCMSSIALGLSVSKPLMSLGVLGLIVVWLIDGNLKAKLNAFWDNKIALLISSIYLISVLGLIHTSNFEFAAADLRRKLPLFFIPFCVSGFSAITKKELYLLLKVFIIGVLISTLWSLFVYLGGLNEIIVDVRDYSRFHSHIRFGLTVSLAIFFCFYYAFNATSLKQKLAWSTLSVWLIASLVLFSLFTGLIVFMATGALLLVIFGILNPNKLVKAFSSIIFFGTLATGIAFISVTVSRFNESVLPKTIKEKKFTTLGNSYQNNNKINSKSLRENGYFLEKHISWGELAFAWDEKSKIKFEEKDLKGNLVKNTLIRFISSKGFRKDKEGVDQLTDKEIRAIENGISNYLYLEMNPVSTRIHKILWEYNNAKKGGDINGHSVLMRIEYWVTAITIIKNNPLLGVGTGDVQDAFNNQYAIDNSSLTSKYRLRTHNQFFTYAVSFGLIGSLWFLYSLFYPLFINENYKNFLYLSFMGVILLSMLTEDTLEVQAGINLFVFFITILVNKHKSIL